MKRVTFTQPPIISPYHYQPQTADPEPRSELRDKVHAAAAAGLALAILLSIGVIAASTIINLPIGPTGILILCAFLLGLAFAAYLVLRWSHTVATRAWEIEDTELSRKWKAEDAEQKRLQELRDTMQETKQPTQIDRIHEVTFTILTEHYAGRSTSRERCVKLGLCNQEEWNTVNSIFKTLTWKKGNTLTVPHPTLTEAWHTFQAAVVTDERARDKLWVTTGPDSEKGITI
jgi:hypothetical protein